VHGLLKDPALFCSFDRDCPGTTKTTHDGVKYCPECGAEDFSEMKET
jgi:hypothetical protein